MTIALCSLQQLMWELTPSVDPGWEGSDRQLARTVGALPSELSHFRRTDGVGVLPARVRKVDADATAADAERALEVAEEILAGV